MILFVDDEWFRLQSYIDWFKARDIKCFTARTIDEAEEKLRVLKNEVKLVILDVIVPFDSTAEGDRAAFAEAKRGGLWLLRHIKQKYPGLPIVVFTVLTKAEIEAKFPALGLTEKDVETEGFYEKRDASIVTLGEAALKLLPQEGSRSAP